MILYCQMFSRKEALIYKLSPTAEYHFNNILTHIGFHEISYFFLACLNGFDCQINQISSICLFTGFVFFFMTCLFMLLELPCFSYQLVQTLHLIKIPILCHILCKHSPCRLTLNSSCYYNILRT